MATDYPATYPKPLRAQFSAATNTGVRRVEFESGYARQRRFFKTLPTQVNLGFVVPYAEFKDWLDWVNDHAYEWINLPVPNPTSAGQGKGLCDSVQELRFISDLDWNIVGDGYVEIKVAGEFKV